MGEHRAGARDRGRYPSVRQWRNLRLARVVQTLEADKTHSYKAGLAVFVDTSSSNRNAFQPLRTILDDLDHPALLMADCIAGMACDRFEMDEWGIDVAVKPVRKKV